MTGEKPARLSYLNTEWQKMSCFSGLMNNYAANHPPRNRLRAKKGTGEALYRYRSVSILLQSVSISPVLFQSVASHNIRTKALRSGFEFKTVGLCRALQHIETVNRANGTRRNGFHVLAAITDADSHHGDATNETERVLRTRNFAFLKV